MKRFTLFLVAVTFLTACASPSTATPSPTETPEPIAFETFTAPNEGSFIEFSLQMASEITLVNETTTLLIQTTVKNENGKQTFTVYSGPDGKKTCSVVVGENSLVITTTTSNQTMMRCSFSTKDGPLLKVYGQWDTHTQKTSQ